MAELKSNSTLGANLIATETSVALQKIVDIPWDNTFSTSLLIAYRSNGALTWHGSDDKTVLITSPPIYSPADYILSSNISSVSEGDSVQFDLTTYKVSDGTVLYYDVESLTGNVTANDFSSAASGNFNVTANSGNVILTLANDRTTEGTESFKLRVRTDNASGNIVASSNVIVIDVSLDPTYTLSSNLSLVPEGSNVLVTLTTTGVDQGTTIPYTISGVTTDDFDPALSSLTDNFTADSNGSDTLELSVALDADSSESESIIVTLGATDSAGFSTGSPSVSIAIEQPISGQNAYTSAGTYEFIVPEGVSSVSAVAIGGGGGGSGFPTGTSYKWPGSGGGGGGLAWATFDVTPGESLDVFVGNGGGGGLNSSGTQPKSGSTGQDSYISRKSVYSLSDLTYTNKVFHANAQVSSQEGITFSTDGYKMYVACYTQDAVFQYDLSSAWDISSASYANKSFSVASQDPVPRDVKFKSDGTIMYVLGSSSPDGIYQYTLSTAWDVSTASYANKSLDVENEDINPSGFSFNSTGTIVYICSYAATINQYNLSTAWDVSTATYSSNSLTAPSTYQSYQDLNVGKNDTRLFVTGFIPSAYSGTGNNAWLVREYSLPADGDVSNASLLSTVDLYGVGPNLLIGDATWSTSGHKFYTYSAKAVYEWDAVSSSTQIIKGGGGGAGTWQYQSYQTISGGSAYANTSLVTSYGLYNGGQGGPSGGFNNTGGGGGGAGGYANANVTISGTYSRGGGNSGGYQQASSGYPGSGGAAGGGGLWQGAPANSPGRGGGGVGILGRGSTGVATVDGFGEGGSGGANATNASGGVYGGGGGAPGGPTNNSGGGFGGSGQKGAVRIIYGSGRSYPDTNTADQ